MDQHYKARWQQAEADLKALCKSNSAHVQSLASKLHETNEEHQQLHTAQERQLQLEAQTLRAVHQRELQAAQSAQESENVIQELRRKAAEQPDIQKLLWKRQLSQQSTYRAEIHELQTEMLNMKEKSEMQSHLAANMCKIEQSVPSRSVESEPDNVLTTPSPGRSTRWILPAELETPNRPTSSGLQSPVGVPVQQLQLGPSPSTQEYVRPAPCGIPPAQWGDLHAREGDDGCELFGNMPEADDLDLLGDPARSAEQQDELENAEALPLVHAQQSPISGARCVSGSLVRPDNAEEEPPSTACRQSAAWQNGIFGCRHAFMVAESGLKMSSIKPHVCVHCKASEQVECPLVFGQGWEHDSKGVCCHPNRFTLSIVM